MKKLIVIPIFLFSQILMSNTQCYNNYEWCMSWAWTYYEYDVSQCSWWSGASCNSNAQDTFYQAMEDCEDTYFHCRNNEL